MLYMVFLCVRKDKKDKGNPTIKVIVKREVPLLLSLYI